MELFGTKAPGGEEGYEPGAWDEVRHAFLTRAISEEAYTTLHRVISPMQPRHQERTLMNHRATTPNPLADLLKKMGQERIQELILDAVGEFMDRATQILQVQDMWTPSTDRVEEHADDHPAPADEQQEIDFFYERTFRLLSEIQFQGEYLTKTDQNRGNWQLKLEFDQKYGKRLYIQVGHWRKNVVTNLLEWGYSRKHYLSPYMTDREIIGAVLGLLLSYQEHEVREGFAYQGKRIFGPHISLDALMEVADRTDYR
jgi:hypothetical protein